MNERLLPSAAAPSSTAARARAQPKLRGERALRLAEGLFSRLDRLITSSIRPELNPLAHGGAIANTALLVACATGVVLLIWYRTSVHTAYPSVAAMDANGIAHFTRSLHRYSSDAALLFALIHALREVSAGKVGRSRWLAWTTGFAVVGALWLVGFLGYWLVWDARGQMVALATARLLDGLPLFSDPLSRSFLADELLSSLLFFVVFFLHMLIPLAMGIGLWLHITRLSRANFLTGRTLTLALLASLSVLALLAPADLAPPAHMALQPSGFTLDGWFLLPLLLGDHLGSGLVLASALLLSVVLFSVPWALTRGRPAPAVVHAGRCNGCERCYVDCPYDAIRMVPRGDGRAHLAVVDPSRCLGCGVCAGSCDSAGIGLPWLDSVARRQALDRQIEAALASGAEVNVAFVCAEALGSREAELAGYQVVSVPCAGWVHPLLAERARRRGAERALVVACAPGGCSYREGGAWTQARFAGEREPKLRSERVGSGVKVVEVHRHERARLELEAERFLRSEPAGIALPPRRFRVAALVAATALALSGVTWAGTQLGYRPAKRAPQLVISMKLAGQAKNGCRPITEEEKKKLPIHMQRQEICERGRADVRLRVSIDGRPLLDRAYAPRGLWGDGNSVAFERWSVPAGEHTVKVEVADDGGSHGFPYASTRLVRFEAGHQASVVFDPSKTFRWYAPTR